MTCGGETRRDRAAEKAARAGQQDDGRHLGSPFGAASGVSKEVGQGYGRPQPPVRITWMSRSRIFLRSVLRFTPKRSAARIWLPRVAASAADNRGYSPPLRMRGERPGAARPSPTSPK